MSVSDDSEWTIQYPVPTIMSMKTMLCGHDKMFVYYYLEKDEGTPGVLCNECQVFVPITNRKVIKHGDSE